MKVARVKRKVFKLQYIHENEKNGRKRKVTFEENTQENKTKSKNEINDKK